MPTKTGSKRVRMDDDLAAKIEELARLWAPAGAEPLGDSAVIRTCVMRVYQLETDPTKKARR